MRENFSGVHWMLATPFFDNENLDLKSMSTLATKAEEFGCTGIVALGVTGEVAKLTDNERTQISETVISSAKNIPITLETMNLDIKKIKSNIRIAENLIQDDFS